MKEFHKDRRKFRFSMESLIGQPKDMMRRYQTGAGDIE